MPREKRMIALKKQSSDTNKTVSIETVTEKIQSGRKLINQTIAAHGAFAKLR